MANVSSSNGLEKRPKLAFRRADGSSFPGWSRTSLSSIIEPYSEKVYGEHKYEVLTSSREGLQRQVDHFGSEQRHDTDGYNVIPFGYCTYRNRSDDGRFAFNINTISSNAIVSKFYPVFRFTNANSLFMSEFLNSSSRAKKKLSVLAVGTSQVVLSFEALKAAEFDLPCKDEQDKIASFFECLNRRIEYQRTLVDALKKYKRGLLNHIFSAFSKGSQRRKLHELVHVSGGKTPSMSNSLYWNGDIVWISSKDMKSSRISGSELKITNLALNEMTLYHPGTLLLVARSGILKHSLPLAILEVDATINQDIKALQVHGCNAFYLYYAILSQEDNIIRTLVKTGTTVQSLMMDSFLDIEIPTPDIDQQQSIIDKLAKLEKYVDVQEKELSLLSQMRNGLLQQLFI